jgi:hypothetical protein
VSIISWHFLEKKNLERLFRVRWFPTRIIAAFPGVNNREGASRPVEKNYLVDLADKNSKGRRKRNGELSRCEKNL